MKSNEVRALMKMMEAMIRQKQSNPKQADKLIDEAWKEMDKRPVVLDGPKGR